MRALAEIQVIPIGVGVSVRREVIRAHDVIRQTGLTTELHAYGTNVEGDLDAILDAVKATLEKTPPELAGDISERGLVLAGGGAHLAGLDNMIREEIGIPVMVAEDPLLAVVRGAGMVLEDVDSYRPILLEDV